jgi:hypothetical protein
MKSLKMLLWLGLILILALGTACTKKDNLTGNNWSNVTPQTIIDSLAITTGYSFPPDTLLTISGAEDKILVGNWHGARAMSLLRFTGMIKDLSTYEIREASLALNILRRNPIARDPLMIRLYKVESGWTDRPDTLVTASPVRQHFAEYTIPNTVSLSGDTIHVELPEAVIKNWSSTADTLGFNILIEAVNEGFIELRAVTNTAGSRLSYKYKTAAQTEFSEYDALTVRDTYGFIVPEAVVEPGVFKLSNFSPARIYVKIEPDSTKYRDMQGNILSPADLKRVNVNKAELILNIKPGTEHLGNIGSYRVFPYYVKTEPEGAEAVPAADLEVLKYSYESLAKNSDEYLAIDITPFVQAYLAGSKENKGIVIRSLNERRDFGEINFYHFVDFPRDKHPYIRVKYTPPYL